MFSKNMREIYKRFLILGLLLMCLFVFGFSDKIETAQAAAPCIQDCEANQAMCEDSCSTSCADDSTDAYCTSCLTNCSQQANDCFERAVWCQNGNVTYNAVCQTHYAAHCPIIGGVADCTHPSAHNNFFQTCNHTSGQCVACPNYEYCYGSNGLPPCY